MCKHIDTLFNTSLCRQVLPCLHTFCERCLISYTPPESLTLTCPVCRQQSILPKDGVSSSCGIARACAFLSY